MVVKKGVNAKKKTVKTKKAFNKKSVEKKVTKNKATKKKVVNKKITKNVPSKKKVVKSSKLIVKKQPLSSRIETSEINYKHNSTFKYLSRTEAALIVVSLVALVALFALMILFKLF